MLRTYLRTYMYLPTYLPASLPASQPACLPACQQTYLPTYLPLPTCDEDQHVDHNLEITVCRSKKINTLIPQPHLSSLR